MYVYVCLRVCACVHAVSVSLPTRTHAREEVQPDPWSSEEYLMCCDTLQQRLEASDFRCFCKMLKLISRAEEERLMAKLISGGTVKDHNQQLFAAIEKLGNEGFAKFREIVRHMDLEVDAYGKCLRLLDSVGWSTSDGSKYAKTANTSSACIVIWRVLTHPKVWWWTYIRV